MKSYHILSDHIISYHIISYHIIPAQSRRTVTWEHRCNMNASSQARDSRNACNTLIWWCHSHEGCLWCPRWSVWWAYHQYHTIAWTHCATAPPQPLTNQTADNPTCFMACFHMHTDMQTYKHTNIQTTDVPISRIQDTQTCMHLNTPEVQRTMHLFLIVHAAVTPVRVLPAPHGSTIIPLRARPLPNIFRRLFSCDEVHAWMD